MNDWLLTFLSLGFSGSLLILLLLSLRRALCGHVSWRWQYYIWMVVVFRLLLPVGPQDSLTGWAVKGIEQIGWISSAPSGNTSPPSPTEFTGETGIERPLGEEHFPSDPTILTPAEAPAQLFQELTQSLWLLWLVGGFTLLVRKCSSYHAFLGYIKAGRRPIKDGPVLDVYQSVCREMGISHPPPLYLNAIASAPMLVGVFRPFIVLPALEEEEMAGFILRHELIHYRRGDIFYKWIAQLAACLHWYNPLVYILLREINRCCELSCDEALIRSLDEAGQYSYGETLLATIKPNPGYSNSIVSITLNEDIQRLKERLDAIMNYSKKSLAGKALSTGLAVCVAALSLWTGVYAAPQDPVAQESGRSLDVTSSTADTGKPQGSQPEMTPAEPVQGYLDASTSWQEHLQSGELITNQWPNYMAINCAGTLGNPVGNSFDNRNDTEVLLTVLYTSGSLRLAVRAGDGSYPFSQEITRSGQYRFVLPGVEKTGMLELYVSQFHGGVLMESIDGRSARGNPQNNSISQVPTSPNDHALPTGNPTMDIAEYLDTFAYWNEYGIQSDWPRNLRLHGQMSSSGSMTYGDLQVDEPTSVVITAHTLKGSFGLRIVDPVGNTIFDQEQIIAARYRVNLARTGNYRIYYNYHQYNGRMIMENEAYTDVFAGVNLGETFGDDAPYDPPVHTSDKSVSVDEGAYQVMNYAGSWDMVELLLPYMTREGIDKVVALNNSKSPYNQQLASDYYNLATPSKKESDERAYRLIDLSANWSYASPLFPYMSNEGIDAVIAVYNQRTGNRIVPAEYYN